MFVRRAMARPEIVRVVRVDAVGNRAEIPFLGQSLHAIEKLVLAVVAAIGVVRDVQGILEFARLDEFVPNSGCEQELLPLARGRARKNLAIKPSLPARERRAHGAPPKPDTRNPRRPKMQSAGNREAAARRGVSLLLAGNRFLRRRNQHWRWRSHAR